MKSHSSLFPKPFTSLRCCAMVGAIAIIAVLSAAAQSGLYTQFISAGSFPSAGTRSPDLLIGRTDFATNRGYCAFHLPRFVGTPKGAFLELGGGALRTSGDMETLQVREVLTPPESVYNYVTNAPAVFRDLGDGVVFGTQAVTNKDSVFNLEFALNDAALASLRTNAGCDFVLGLELSAAETSAPPAYLVFSSYYPTPLLTLTFSGTSAPVILESAPETVSAYTNNPAELRVNACGAPDLAFQWFREGELIPGATNSSLCVTNDAPGQYWAVVTNSLGCATSGVTRVIVNESPPEFWQDPPAFQSAMAGTTVQLMTTLSGTAPLTLQWFFNGTPLPGQTSMSLVLNNCRVESSGFYWLTASNQAGVASSRAAQLTVRPLDISIYGGDPYAGSVFYLVAGTYSISPEVNYQWRHTGTNLPGGNAATLTFTNLSLTQNGDYDVVACNLYGCSTSAVHRLTILTAPPSLEALSCPSNTPTGRELSIASTLLGAQPLSLQWYFNGTPLEGETNDSLVIPSAQPRHTGLYSLVASNCFGGPVSRSIYASVSGEPPGNFYLLADGGWPGKPCLLKGAVDYLIQGVPGSPSTFSWSRDGVQLDSQTNYFLFCTNFSVADAGTYTLTAANDYGSASASCLVSVYPRRALEQWTWRAPLPQGNDLHNLAAGNGCYVAIGDNGQVICSADAVNWTQAIPASAGSIRFHKGEFLLLPWHYPPAWTTPAWVSPNGRDWMVREVTAHEVDLADSVFGNGIYTCGSRSSFDGVHWRAAAPDSFSRIAFGNGRFVGLTYYWGPGSGFWTSTDGFAWFLNPSSIPLPVRGLAFGKGLFVATGEDGFVFTSADGVSWTSRGRVVSRDLNDVVFDGSQFIACGNRGLVATSLDGVAWTLCAGEREDLFGVVFAQNKFVTVGDQGAIFSSPDGIAWTAQYSGTSRDLHGLTYGNGMFVAVGRRGTVLTSPDGVIWAARATGTASYLERIAYGEGKFIAVGNTPPTILTSQNALNWQIADLAGLNVPADARFEGAACGNGLFMVVGGHFLDPVNEVHAVPDLLVSSNGVTWERRIAPQVPNDGRILRNATFAAGKFVVVGNDGMVSWSTNASSWTPGVSLGPNLRSVTFCEPAARFVAVGNGGSVISGRNSPASLSWDSHRGDVAQNFHDLAFGGNRFVAVGNGGTIVHSGLPVPIFESHRMSPPTFTIQGGIEAEYTVEAAEGLDGVWLPSCVYTNDGVPVVVEDSAPAAQRFFRAISR